MDSGDGNGNHFATCSLTLLLNAPIHASIYNKHTFTNLSLSLFPAILLDFIEKTLALIDYLFLSPDQKKMVLFYYRTISTIAEQSTNQ